MLRQTFQRMTSSRHDIYHDISNICRNIKFRGKHQRQENSVATKVEKNYIKKCHDKRNLCHDTMKSGRKNHFSRPRFLCRNIRFKY